MKQERMSMFEIQYWIKTCLKNTANQWTDEAETDFTMYNAVAQKSIPYSDVNAAREIFKTFQHRIHYVPGTSSWYVWNDVFHEKIDGDLLSMWICDYFIDQHRDTMMRVKQRYDALAAIQPDEVSRKRVRDAYTKTDFKDHRDYRDKIHSRNGVMNLTNQIKSVFSVVDSHFVDDTRWLVLNNGVIDLHELRTNPPMPGDLGSIRLLPHDPARPVYRAVNASLRPGADSVRWRGFLETSIPDADLRKFLAVVTGAAVLAEAKTKTIPVLTGGKDSGKTIYIDTIHKLVGGYGGQPDTSAINKSNGPNFEQDAFRGLRFVGISEPNTDRKVDDSFLKKFTGGDILSTRNLHARSLEWKSQGVLFIATNNEIKFNTHDKAILERFATVTFPHRFYPKGQVPEGKEEFVHDKNLERDLARDLDGILSWVLNGMLVYLHEGIVIPESVTAERGRRYVEGSSVNLWVEEYVKDGQASFVLSDEEVPASKYATLQDAHLQYSSWCSLEHGDQPLGLKTFSRHLQEYLDVTTVRSGPTRVPKLVYKDALDALLQEKKMQEEGSDPV